MQTNAFTYGDANWKDKLTALNGTSITYDAIGNPLNDGTWSYTWAKGRQLQSMSKNGTSISYTYNEDGLRVGKNVNGTATTYVLHGKNVVHLTQGSNNLHFFYGADGSPAIVEYNGVNYGYARNLQGDIIAIIRGTGEIVVQYTYDAWGKPTSKTGSMADTLGTLNPFRYRGYVYDEETGLYYLRSRYYNPIHARFINSDSRIGRVSQIMSHNAYSYCSNEPITSLDSTGNSAISAIQKLKNKIGQFVSNIITSAKTLMTTDRVIEDCLVTKGKIYKLQPPSNEITISPRPKVITRGHGSYTEFSGKLSGINLAKHDFETTGLMYIYTNSLITTQVNVKITQEGDLEPKVGIVFSLTFGYADTSNGVHEQKVMTTEPFQIYRRRGDLYWCVDGNGNEYTCIDSEGWIDKALDRMKWE